MIAGYETKGVLFRFGPGGYIDSADLVVRSPGVPPGIPPLVAAKARGIPVSSGTQLFLELCPAPVIGVTGTKGKGTTASLIHEMFRAAGRTSHLVGNIGLPALAALSDIYSDSVVIYELSSFQLIDIKRSPNVAVVLMVTSDHLDFHADEKEYVEAKANIVRFQSPEDIAIVNADYESSRMIGALSPGRQFWVSRHRPVAEGCFVKDGAIVLRKGGSERVIAQTDKIALYGDHNLENACAAVMAAEVFGIPEEAMRATLASFRGLPHRLQLVGTAGGVKYFDDSISTTPESAIAAIRAFQEPKVIILGGSGKGADFRGLAEVIAGDAGVKAVIGIGEEWPRIKKEIESGIWNLESKQKLKIIENLATMEEVVEKAAELVDPGDVVLLSPGCASFGMFRNYKDRGEQFGKAVRSLES